eukprot:6411062-Amphidinium_carterae.2
MSCKFIVCVRSECNFVRCNAQRCNAFLATRLWARSLIQNGSKYRATQVGMPPSMCYSEEYLATEGRINT